MKINALIILFVFFLTCFSTFAYAAGFEFPEEEEYDSDISKSAEQLSVHV